MTTVLVASVIATKCRNGGNARAVLNWVQGLRKLGVQAYYVEQIASQHCVDDRGQAVPFAQSANVAYFEHVMRHAGLAEVSTLVCDGGPITSGLPFRELLDVADAADLLLNITGHLTLEPLLRRIRRKAYLDLDPGFTQIWHAEGHDGARLNGHDMHFTIGENIGTSGCAIPVGDIRWRHTRQPAVLSADGAEDGPWRGRFTTIASWRGPYGPVQQGTTTFGLKVHEFRKLLDLPQRAAATFEIALDIHPADERDLRLLRGHGWRIVDPVHAVPDPQSYDDYIMGSDAECSAAQGVYVATNSGWFSDRTVRYLAAGRPALVQDTGFSHRYPVGDGLIAFRTVEDAARGVDAIQRDPRRHQRAARALAAEYFDSNAVIGRLLDEAGVVA
jgi:hypothetical protein